MAEKALALQTLSERFADVRKRIEKAAQSRNRSPEDITLVAISKTHPTETVRGDRRRGNRRWRKPRAGG